jgi:hypothetical protein
LTTIKIRRYNVGNPGTASWRASTFFGWYICISGMVDHHCIVLTCLTFCPLVFNIDILTFQPLVHNIDIFNRLITSVAVVGFFSSKRSSLFTLSFHNTCIYNFCYLKSNLYKASECQHLLYELIKVE